MLLPELIVPIGAPYRGPSDVGAVSHRIVFIGSLLEKQGVRVVLRGLPAVIEQVPEVMLRMIGEGSFEGELRSLARRLGIEDHIEWLGRIDDHGTVMDRLSECAIGLAPYRPGANSSDYLRGSHEGARLSGLRPPRRDHRCPRGRRGHRPAALRPGSRV